MNAHSNPTAPALIAAANACWEDLTAEQLRRLDAELADADAQNEEDRRLADKLERELAKPGGDVLDYLGIDVKGVNYTTGSIWAALEAHSLGMRPPALRAGWGVE